MMETAKRPPAKLVVENLYKVFGKAPAQAVEELKADVSKETLMQKSGSAPRSSASCKYS